MFCFEVWSNRSAVSVGSLLAKVDIMCTGWLSIHRVTVMLSDDVVTEDEPLPFLSSSFELERASFAPLMRLDLKVPTT